MHRPVSTSSTRSPTYEHPAGSHQLATCDLDGPSPAKSTECMPCSAHARAQVSKCHMPVSVSHGSDRAEGLIPDTVWEKYLLKLGSMETCVAHAHPTPTDFHTSEALCTQALYMPTTPRHTHTQCFMNIPLFLAQLRPAGAGCLASAAVFGTLVQPRSWH